MSKTAFGGRGLGEAFDVTLEMVRDPKCKVVLTLSGAMTIAKMGRVISKMIDSGMVHAVVSTGALMAHGLSEAVGLAHYRHDPRFSDEELFHKGYNRVYDTLEQEANLDYVEAFAKRAMGAVGDQVLSSEILNRALGEVLAKEGHAGVLRSAYEKGVPVYIPAFTDSELGLDLATWSMREGRGRAVADDQGLYDVIPQFNPFLDLNSFARFCTEAERIGIFTIGGGVPRNWAQEVGPFVDVMNTRLGRDEPDAPQYLYAVRICPEPAHWGGLSGCTYTEGVSWGKFVPRSKGGRFAEVHADATTVWPLLIKAVLEELDSATAGGAAEATTRIHP